MYLLILPSVLVLGKHRRRVVMEGDVDSHGGALEKGKLQPGVKNHYKHQMSVGQLLLRDRFNLGVGIIS